MAYTFPFLPLSAKTTQWYMGGQSAARITAREEGLVQPGDFLVRINAHARTRTCCYYL